MISSYKMITIIGPGCVCGVWGGGVGGGKRKNPGSAEKGLKNLGKVHFSLLWLV